MAVLFTPTFVQLMDSDGNPLSGGKIYTYQAGSFSAPKATYTDNLESAQNTNPVILDSAGRAEIWITGSYNFKITDADDVIIRTSENVTSFNTLAEASTPFFNSFSGDATTTDFVLSADVGTDSREVMVFINRGLEAAVSDGNFDTGTPWTKGTGWSVGSGVATAAGAISTALSQTSIVPLIEEQAYSVTYTVTRSAGGLIPSIGGRSGTERTASGTYTEIIVAGSTQEIAFTGNAFTGTVDSIVINQAVSSGPGIINPSAYTISGTGLAFAVAPPSGTDNIFVFAPSLLVGSATTAAASAAASESNAAASEAAAALSAASLTGTSTTSLLIGVASKVFTTQADKYFAAGSFLLITSDADPTNYMFGQVTTYSGTSLTVNVTGVGGSGTLADWTIRVAGTQGAAGPAGSVTDGDKGDIVVSGSGATWTIDDDAVTADKTDTSVNAIGSIGGGTQDIDLDDGRSVSGTVDTSTTTFTFSNPKATGNEDGFVLYLTNGGSQTVNWPASVDWVAATAPTLTTAGVDVLVFSTINGGTIWNGFVVGLDVS